MASKRWLGRAQAVAQVDTVTMAGAGDWVAGDTITLTINAKDLVVTIGTLVTDAQVATTVKQAWENETFTDTTASKTPAAGGDDIVEHAEITATVSGAVVTLTHDTPGTPFTLAVTESVTGDETATEATATAATGPNFWDNAANWDGGVVPTGTNADDVYIDNSAVSILYGLGASAVTLTSMTIARNFTGTIGLPKQNIAGYVEYRADYLTISVTTLNIGRGDGSGSGRIKIDTGTVQTAITIENMGSSAEGTNVEAFLWKGTHASSTLEVHQGTVGVAVFGGEVATILTLLVGAGTVRCGAGTTLTTITSQAGELELYSNITTLTMASGTILIGGAATLTTLNLNGGTLQYQSSGILTTANVGGPSGGTLDFSGDNSTRVVTTCNLKANGQIIDPLRTADFSANGIAVGSDAETISAG